MDSGSDGEESACNAGDLDSIPGSGRSHGEGCGNPFHYSVWRVPWTEEPGEPQSEEWQESDATTHTHTAQQSQTKHCVISHVGPLLTFLCCSLKCFFKYYLIPY